MLKITKLSQFFKNKALTIITAVLLVLPLFTTNAQAANTWIFGFRSSGEVFCYEPSGGPVLDQASFPDQSSCEAEFTRRQNAGKLFYFNGSTDCFIDNLASNTKGKYDTYANCRAAEIPNQKWRIIDSGGQKYCGAAPPGYTGTTYNTRDECFDAAYPGNYKVVKKGSRYNCQKDNSGTLTYSQCLNQLTEKNASGPPGKNPCGEGKECPTALGNIPTDTTAFAGKVLSIGIGLAGGIALIFMVFGSIKILTSAGDPKKVADGREIIVAAIAGTLFLILSVLILRFIGGTFLPTNPFS